MTTAAPAPTDVLEAVSARGPPGTPVTTPEVAEAFDCTQRTIYNRLEALVEDGPLETKKVGARGRVWWQPAGTDEPAEHDTEATVTESTFRQLFENVPGLYLIVEPENYEIVAVSDAYLDATMTERVELMGKTLFEVFPADPDDPDPEGAPRLRRSLERVKAERKTDVMPVTFYPIPRPDAENDEFEDRWWNPTNAPVVDESGEINYIIHRVEDVTSVVRQLQDDGGETVLDRLDTRDSHLATDIMLRGQELHEAKEAADERLQENEERLNAFVTATSDVVYRMSPDWSEMYHLDGQEFIVDTEEPRETWLEEYIPADERPRVMAAIEEAIETKSTFELEHQVLQVDGTRGWTHSRAVPMLDDDGEIVEWFGTASDITERKRREEELHETTEKLEMATTAGGVGLWTLDVETDVVSADAFIAETYGMDLDEVAAGAPLEEFFEPIHGDDRDRARNALERARMETDELNVEHRVRGADGNWIWADVRAKMEYNERGEKVRLNGTMIDVTERKQREQLLNEQKELLELIAEGASLEECLTELCTAVARLGAGVRASVMLADDERESFQRPIAPDLHPSWGEGLEDAPINDLMIGTCGDAVFRGETVTCEDVTTDDRWSEAWRELCVANGVYAGQSKPILDSDGDPLGSFMLCFDEPRVPTDWERQVADFGTDIAGIAVEREQSRRALVQVNNSLERLNAASRELIDADTETIDDHVAELTRDVLGVEYATLWRYDEVSGAVREDASSTVSGIDHGTLQLPDGFTDTVWQTFIGDEIDVRNDLDVPADEPSGSRLRSRVLLPLGRHGVVCAGSTRPGAFDERKIDLAETVTATVETAWDRAESEMELERQNEELTRLDRLNTLIREIDQALVAADTREEIDDAVCERLADSGLYEFAWIGNYDPATEVVEPRAWAGIDSGYLEDLTIAVEDTPTNRDPIARAVRTDELQVITDIATDLGFAPWREATLERGARSVVCIPLVYDEAAYGVLTVYSDRPQSDERDLDVLSELGATIAHTINARETRATLQTDTVVELRLRFEDADTTLGRLARETGGILDHQGFVPRSNGHADVYFTARETSPEDVRGTAAQLLAFEDLDCLTEGTDGCLFRARVSDPPLAARVTDEGGVVRSITIDAGVATAVLDVPHTAAVREFLDRLRRRTPEFELRARRSRERPLKTRQTFVATLEDRLTDRQRGVLQTAYLSGFFETPRVSNGREVTELLGVSQPTFSEHLRAAERILCEVLFETESDAESSD